MRLWRSAEDFPVTEPTNSSRRRAPAADGLARPFVESKAPGQLFASHPAVVEDLAQQARSDRFLSVNRDDREPTIRMPEEVMTPPDPNDFESEPPQRADELLPR